MGAILINLNHTLQMEKLNAEMEEQISANTQLLADNSQKQVELKLKEEDIENLKEELVSVNKVPLKVDSINSTNKNITQ